MNGAEPCSCGSGEIRSAQYDARGIFLCYACVECVDDRLEGFRSEVLSDPNYDAPDLGEDEHLEREYEDRFHIEDERDIF